MKTIKTIHMKVIIEVEIENCKECPCYSCEGTSWGKNLYVCTKTKNKVNGGGIPNSCPLIESTIERLRLLSGRS